MNRKTLAKIASVIGVVLTLMLASGAPDDFGIRAISLLTGGM